MTQKVEQMTLGIFGSYAVGKTCVSTQFISNLFLQEHDPTMEDFFETTKKIPPSQDPVQLTLFDTAGQELYSTLLAQHMRDSEGILLVYSVTDKESLEKVRNIHSKILEIKETKKVPFVLIGNKIDLVDHRKISTEEGKKMAEELGNIPFLETSAKTRTNIDEAFAALVNEVRRFKLEAKAKNGKGKKKDCIIS